MIESWETGGISIDAINSLPSNERAIVISAISSVPDDVRNYLSQCYGIYIPKPSDFTQPTNSNSAGGGGGSTKQYHNQ